MLFSLSLGRCLSCAHARVTESIEGGPKCAVVIVRCKILREIEGEREDSGTGREGRNAEREKGKGVGEESALVAVT